MTDMRTKPRSRTITWDDPMRALAEGAPLSGLEFIRAIFDGKLPSPPITATMGFTGGSVAEGKVTFVGEASAPIQPHRRRARRFRDDDARLGHGLRGAHHPRGGRGVHDARGESELRAPDYAGYGTGSLRRHGHPPRRQDSDRRR